ncbi:MAG: D-alanyl-D-alanine carboxypeptidase family protein [Patescibacteria group bacterium]
MAEILGEEKKGINRRRFIKLVGQFAGGATGLALAGCSSPQTPAPSSGEKTTRPTEAITATPTVIAEIIKYVTSTPWVPLATNTPEPVIQTETPIVGVLAPLPTETATPLVVIKATETAIVASTIELKKPTVAVAPTITSTAEANMGTTCKQVGKEPYSPQPKSLGKELCADGGIPTAYSEKDIPEVVDLKKAIEEKLVAELGEEKGKTEAVKFFIKDGVQVSTGIVDSTLKMLRDFYKLAEDDPSKYCQVYVYSGYRSFADQKKLFDDNKCKWDPKLQMNVKEGTTEWCQVGTPGWSTHQSGVAVDMWCAAVTKDKDGKITKVDVDWRKEWYVRDVFGRNKFQEYHFIFPINTEGDLDPSHSVNLD